MSRRPAYRKRAELAPNALDVQPQEGCCLHDFIRLAEFQQLLMLLLRTVEVRGADELDAREPVALDEEVSDDGEGTRLAGTAVELQVELGFEMAPAAYLSRVKSVARLGERGPQPIVVLWLELRNGPFQETGLEQDPKLENVVDILL